MAESLRVLRGAFRAICIYDPGARPRPARLCLRRCAWRGACGASGGAKAREAPRQAPRARRECFCNEATKGVTQAMEHKVFSTELAGRTLTFEFGQATPSRRPAPAFVRYGDTVVLVNATVAETPRPGIDFFPLSVDFEEKLYSVGKIPGGFIKREGRPDGEGDPDLPPDRPPAAPALPQGHAQRRAASWPPCPVRRYRTTRPRSPR